MNGAEDTLRKIFERRWKVLAERSKRWQIPLCDKEALWEKVLNRYRGNWTCIYCGKSLEITNSTPPYPDVWSLEHYIPFALNGDNNLENISIACVQCNIIKGTMMGDTFSALLDIVPPALQMRMFMEGWKGRIASKLERVEAEESNG